MNKQKPVILRQLPDLGRPAILLGGALSLKSLVLTTQSRLLFSVYDMTSILADKDGV